MKSIIRSLAAALFCCSIASAAAQTVNPLTDIRWSKLTGSGSPTSACTSANYGQPYTDTTNNKEYFCSAGGWQLGSGASIVYPVAGVVASTGTAWRAPTFTDIVALWAAGGCTSGYLKFDGTCSTPSGGAALPLSATTVGAGMCMVGDSPIKAGATTDANQVYALLYAAYNNQGCIGPSFGGTEYSNSRDGDATSLDVADGQIWPNLFPPDSATTDYFVQDGFGDSFVISGTIGWAGTITNPEAAYIATKTAEVAWLGTPASAKVLATSLACTTTGTWTPVTSFRSGTVLEGSTGATMTCTTPYNATGAIYLAWEVTSGGTAQAGATIDGVSIGNLSAGLAGSISTVSGVSNSAMWWGARYPITGVGTHVLNLTVNAGPFGFVFMIAPTPPNIFQGLNPSKVYMATIPPSPGGLTGAESLLNADLFTVVNQANSDGLNTVQVVDLRNAFPEYVEGTSSYYEYSGGTYPDGTVCPASTVGNPHPGDCGQRWEAWVYLLAAGKTPLGSTAQDIIGDSTVTVTPQGNKAKLHVPCVSIACLAASNNFSGTQTLTPASYTSPAVVLSGTTSGILPPVVSGYFNSGGGSSISVIGAPAGATLVAFCDGGLSSDWASDTFHAITDDGEVYVYYASNIAGGSGNVNCSYGGSVYVLTNVPATGTFDAYAKASHSSSPQSLSITNAANTILIAAVGTSPYNSVGDCTTNYPSTGWLSCQHQPKVNSAYYFPLGAGSSSVTWTYTSGVGSLFIVSFKGLSGAPQVGDLMPVEPNGATAVSAIDANGNWRGASGSSETVAYSATPTFSTTTRSSVITLTGNITSFTLPAGIDGQEKTLCFAQDSTGSWTVAGPSNVHGLFTVGSAASKVSCQHFTYWVSLAEWAADSAGVINQ